MTFACGNNERIDYVVCSLSHIVFAVTQYIIPVLVLLIFSSLESKRELSPPYPSVIDLLA